MIVTLLAVPLLFLSGVPFPLEHLPRLLTALTVMDPLYLCRRWIARCTDRSLAFQ